MYYYGTYYEYIKFIYIESNPYKIEELEKERNLLLVCLSYMYTLLLSL